MDPNGDLEVKRERELVVVAAFHQDQVHTKPSVQITTRRNNQHGESELPRETTA